MQKVKQKKKELDKIATLPVLAGRSRSMCMYGLVGCFFFIQNLFALRAASVRWYTMEWNSWKAAFVNANRPDSKAHTVDVLHTSCIVPRRRDSWCINLKNGTRPALHVHCNRSFIAAHGFKFHFKNKWISHAPWNVGGQKRGMFAGTENQN